MGQPLHLPEQSGFAAEVPGGWADVGFAVLYINQSEVLYSVLPLFLFPTSGLWISTKNSALLLQLPCSNPATKLTF